MQAGRSRPGPTLAGPEKPCQGGGRGAGGGADGDSRVPIVAVAATARAKHARVVCTGALSYSSSIEYPSCERAAGEGGQWRGRSSASAPTVCSVSRSARSSASSTTAASCASSQTAPIPKAASAPWAAPGRRWSTARGGSATRSSAPTPKARTIRAGSAFLGGGARRRRDAPGGDPRRGGGEAIAISRGAPGATGQPGLLSLAGAAGEPARRAEHDLHHSPVPVGTRQRLDLHLRSGSAAAAVRAGRANRDLGRNPAASWLNGWRRISRGRAPRREADRRRSAAHPDRPARPSLAGRRAGHRLRPDARHGPRRSSRMACTTPTSSPTGRTPPSSSTRRAAGCCARATGARAATPIGTWSSTRRAASPPPSIPPSTLATGTWRRGSTPRWPTCRAPTGPSPGARCSRCCASGWRPITPDEVERLTGVPGGAGARGRPLDRHDQAAGLLDLQRRRAAHEYAYTNRAMCALYALTGNFDVRGGNALRPRVPDERPRRAGADSRPRSGRSASACASARWARRG